MITLDWILLQDLDQSVAHNAVNTVVQNEQIETQISRFGQIAGEEAKAAIAGEDEDCLVRFSEPSSYAQAEGATHRRAPVKTEERAIRIGTLGNVLTVLVRHTHVIEPDAIFLPESIDSSVKCRRIDEAWTSSINRACIQIGRSG